MRRIDNFVIDIALVIFLILATSLIAGCQHGAPLPQPSGPWEYLGDESTLPPETISQIEQMK